MTVLRTLAIEVVRKMKIDNIVAKLELFQDKFEHLNLELKKVGVL